MQELPLNGFYSGESKKLSDRRCVNFMPTVSDNGALSTLSLMPTSGIKYHLGSGVVWDTDYSTGNLTGQVYTFENNNFTRPNIFIVGRKLVASGGDSISSVTLPQTPTGGGGLTTGKCETSRFASNPDRAIVVGPSYTNARDRAYVIDKNLALTAEDLVTALGNQNVGLVDIEYLGGRFLYLCSQEGYNAVYYTALGGTTPNSLDFFAPDSNNEVLQGLKVINNTLYLFAKTKCYLYQVTENTDLPYRQIGVVDIGLNGAHAKDELNGSIVLYGKSKGGQSGVYVVSGGGYSKISTRQIDLNLSENESSIRVFVMSDKHRKLVIAKTDSCCFAYDTESGLWHERKSEGSSTWDFIGYGEGSGEGCIVGSSFNNVGGRLFAEVGTLERDIGTELAASFPAQEFNGIVERMVTSSPFNGNNDRMIVNEIQPQCEVDYSNPVEGWYDSKVNMSISYDFGNTFETEKSLPISKAGEYNSVTRFFNIGYINQSFVVMLRVFNPYPTRIIKLLTRIQKGSF